jgi:3-phosphoglycerate kinase
MKKVKNLNLKEKKVLVRVDFNVPIKEGRILDDFRIKSEVPTLKYLIKKGAKITLISHLGRPKDREKEYSLKPVAKRLERILKKKVKFFSDCIGKEVEKKVSNLKRGEILLLENLRFYREEEEGNFEFAKKLAKPFEIFIQDAFACCHRPHSSISLLPKILPSAAGFLLEKEIKSLNKIVKKPKRPLLAIFGGKEADFSVINEILKKADWVFLGGLISRQMEKEKFSLSFPEKVLRPIDELDSEDLGQKTIEILKEKISEAKTIFWSGPLGKIEEKRFQRGTKEIAKAIAKSKAFSVVGGGETIDFIFDLKLEKKFSHLSTGGNAMLEFLAGKKLPGIEALK